jgi:hypothetical protein
MRFGDGETSACSWSSIFRSGAGESGIVPSGITEEGVRCLSVEGIGTGEEC